MKKFFPKEGSKRTITKFIWFPLLIDGQMRWLESAKWE